MPNDRRHIRPGGLRGVSIGHVHLKVADLQRALDFYSGVLGFELTLRFGSSAAFLSAGGYHHHIGLNTWESWVERPRRRAQQGCTTWRYFTRPVLPWPMRCGG